MLRFHLAVAVFCATTELVIASCGCFPCLFRMCMPMRMPCPPPILCRPTICPAPIPCPPQPICPPPQPQICAPPPICPQPQQMCMPRPMFIRNVCCNRCLMPCLFRGRRRRSISYSSASALQIYELEDPKCNSFALRTIMLDKISTDATRSRNDIQMIGERKLNIKLNVICASGDLSYIAYTKMFCQVVKNGTTCYAFNPL